MRIDRTTMAMGAGAGIGVIQTVLMKEYVDAALGPIPGIGDYLGVWGRWSTFGNIVIGGLAFGISQFTNIVKNTDINGFLTIYGITTLVGGIMNGVFPAGLGLRAAAARAPVRLAAAKVMPQTPTGIPPARVLA